MKSTIAEGDWINVDGDGGGVYLGRREIIVERPEAELAEIEQWRSTARACKSASGT
jgi:pyruvate,orthophosphate dikinase